MATTVGILSILEGPERQEALRLWELFETEYGSRGVQAFAHPNLTFHAGGCLDIAALDDALPQICHTIYPLEVEIDGLGCFESDSPVIYMNVIPDGELLALHEQIGSVMGFHCVSMFEHYLADVWAPHVTLAMDDLTPANFQRAWGDLRDYHPRFRATLTNIHLVRRDSETGLIEIVTSYSCGERTAGAP